MVGFYLEPGEMNWLVSKEFSFEAAHSLPHLPASHKCHHLHGHSYKLVVVCESNELQVNRFWVVDYADISKAVDPLVELVDHKNLNKVLNCPTTAEKIAQWFFMRLRKILPVTAIEIYETEKTKVIYRPKRESA